MTRVSFPRPPQPAAGEDGSPTVAVAVDADTGVWTSDGQAMLFIPRQFFLTTHQLAEEALGPAAHARLLYIAAYRSAWRWCEQAAAEKGLSGYDVFFHHLDRLSQRGWGQFTVLALDSDTGAASIRVDQSAYVLGAEALPQPRRLCYAVTGWFPGSLEWCAKNLGLETRLTAEEVQCVGAGEGDHCLFNVTPVAA